MVARGRRGSGAASRRCGGLGAEAAGLWGLSAASPDTGALDIAPLTVRISRRTQLPPFGCLHGHTSAFSAGNTVWVITSSPASSPCSSVSPVKASPAFIPYLASPGPWAGAAAHPVPCSWAQQHLMPDSTALQKLSWSPAVLLAEETPPLSPCPCRCCSQTRLPGAGWPRGLPAAGNLGSITSQFGWILRWLELARQAEDKRMHIFRSNPDITFGTAFTAPRTGLHLQKIWICAEVSTRHWNLLSLDLNAHQCAQLCLSPKARHYWRINTENPHTIIGYS